MNVKIVTLIVTFALGLVLACVSSEAQQSAKVPRIGYVTVADDLSSPSPNLQAFRLGLRDLGYIEGKNIVIEFRSAEGKPDRIPSLVAELVQLKVDVLVSQATSGILAAK